ncbi:MAG TPA: CPBP family intramembrane glutamic endopeptidase [Gammaproteobacteria bacterium]|nr:CPBP family intramembrane glutamic endopeptidase [Gammaproteobacteria bacterium]
MPLIASTLRTGAVFLLAIASLLVCASLLSWPVQLLIGVIGNPPFPKTVHFTLVLSALAVAIAYLVFTDRLGPLSGAQIRRHSGRRQLLAGFLAGALILAMVEGTLHLLGMRQMDPDLKAGVLSLALVTVKALAAGLLVGVIEELTYRGAILEGLLRHGGAGVAVMLSSLLYAGVHFIDFPASDPQAGLHWYSGVLMLAQGFHALQRLAIWDSFLTLFLLGLLLSLIRLRTGNLIACIGLHAGIVTLNKILAYATDYREGSPWSFLVNLQDQPNGYLASGCLLICLWIYWRQRLTLERAPRHGPARG